MKSVWSILFLTFASWSYTQEMITISGKIVDVETKEPLAFATINIQNTPKGVVANEEGAFDFTFSKTHLKDTLIFSFTGYERERVLVQALKNRQDLNIELVKQEVMLSEVVITNKELTPWQILKLAINNLKANYPEKPFKLKAFYRDYKLENDKCIGLFEAAISVYDKGYARVPNKNSFKEKVVLEQVRKSLEVKYKTHTFRRVNVIKELLKLNDVRYQSRALDKRNDYNYELVGYEIINDRLMYKIKAVETWTFFIYVDISTYAIPRIEMDYTWIDDIAENEWILGDTIRYKQTAAKVILDFQQIDDKYYPKYFHFIADLIAFEPASDSILFTSYLLQEYMVTDINFNPEEKPMKPDQMNPDEIIEKQNFSYNPEFWKDYNVLKLHPRDELLIQGLEERMKLPEQFSSPSVTTDQSQN